MASDSSLCVTQPGLHKELLCTDLTVWSQIHWGKKRGTHTHTQSAEMHVKPEALGEKKTLDFQNLACKVTADVCLAASYNLLP